MHRRHLLALPFATVPLLARAHRIDMSRISVITDEAAKSPQEAIAFCKKYNLRWLELRGVPGAAAHYWNKPEEFLKQARREFDDAGLRVSFFNTPFFKITLPGTEPKFRKPETPEAREKRLARHKAEYDGRAENFRQAARASQILGTDVMRVFGFLRVEDPKSVEDRVANEIGEMAEITRKEGVRLLVENEGSCNVATSMELGSIAGKLPAKSAGLNWDPMNGMSFGEVPFPNGYASLPKKRIGNVQIKGRTLLDEKYKLDWAGIFAALVKDGYKGQVGLETHIFGPEQVAKSHESMREIARIVES
ncbi:MAG TPA: TIM barrel protein [Bryobacteraceae bacterium]|nr:TIM barrel protein [Bryobacteraceae bacterium]